MKSEFIQKDVFSVKSYLDKYCGKYANRTFMETSSGTKITYAKLREDSLTLANGLIAKGYTGKHVAILSENRYEYIVFFFASMLAGVVIVPMNLATEPAKIAQMLKFADVTTACISNKTVGLLSDTDCLTEIISFDASDKYVQLTDIFDAGKSVDEAEYYGEFADDRYSMLCFTSGTSEGKAKCVILTAGNMFASARYANVARYLDYGGGDAAETVFYSPLPLFHLAGLVCAVVSAAMPLGSTFVTCEAIASCFGDVKKYEPAHLFIVPALAEAMYMTVMATVKKLGEEENFKEYCRRCDEGMYTPAERREMCRKYTASLGTKMISMTACGALSDITIIKRYGYLGIHVGCDYGLTECSPQVTIAGNLVPKKAGSVGILCDFNDARIVDGVLYIKGDNVMKGYYKNEEGTRAVLSEDGWLCSGDIAEIDEDGYVFIKGRANSVAVLSSGDNIDTDELAALFTASQAISEIIIMADKKNNNDTLGALVYPVEGVTDEDVRKEILRINAELPLQKRIARFRTVDKPFEKNSMMKIKRFMYLKEEI